MRRGDSTAAQVRTRQGVSPLSLLMSSSVNAAAPDVFTKDSNSTLRSAALNLDMQALQATAPGFRVTNGVFFPECSDGANSACKASTEGVSRNLLKIGAADEPTRTKTLVYI